MRKLLQNLALILFGVVATLLMVEFGLRLIDPKGNFVHLEDRRLLNGKELIDLGRTQVLQAGRHELRGYTITITAQHTRLVPGTSYRQDACRVAFVGDSFTMAIGVDDEETWVSELARQYPNLHLINAGMYGYNTEQVNYSITDISANFYIYLLFANDDAATQIGSLGDSRLFISALIAYTYPAFYVGNQRLTLPADDETFAREFAAVISNPDVFVIGFDRDPLVQEMAEQYPNGVNIIPSFSNTVSPSDIHAGPLGNREIANSVSPLLSGWAEEKCPEVDLPS